MNMKTQEEIFYEILELYNEMEEYQKEINKLVFVNRGMPDILKNKDRTENIESYYKNLSYYNL